MTNNIDAFNYYDMHSLQEFKGEVGSGQGDGQKQLEVVASQLESVFLKMMLKSMRDAQQSFESDMFSSNGGDAYQDMYDNQLSLSLSNMKTIGLKEVIMSQLEGSHK